MTSKIVELGNEIENIALRIWGLSPVQIEPTLIAPQTDSGDYWRLSTRSASLLARSLTVAELPARAGIHIRPITADSTTQDLIEMSKFGATIRQIWLGATMMPRWTVGELSDLSVETGRLGWLSPEYESSVKISRFVQKITNFRDLAEGWDGSQANAISEEDINAAIDLVRAVTSQPGYPPEPNLVVPLNDGGFLLVWEKDDDHAVEVRVRSDSYEVVSDSEDDIREHGQLPVETLARLIIRVCQLKNSNSAILA